VERYRKDGRIFRRFLRSLTILKTLTPRRSCALCDVKVKYKERLCPEHLAEYGKDLTSPWLSAIIQESNYQYNVNRRDVRNHVESLDRLLGKV
jgi:hypothetical protein